MSHHVKGLRTTTHAGLVLFACLLPTRVLRPQSAGSVDPLFFPAPNLHVSNIAVQPDGRIVIAGIVNSQASPVTSRVMRLLPNGTVEDSATFNAGTPVDNDIQTLAVQADGKILLGGSFGTVNGQTRWRIARLLPDGSLESTASFKQGGGANDHVKSIALQADGKILIAGAFNHFDGQARNRIARLHPDGTLESASTFNTGAGPDGDVHTISVQADGKILLCGRFTMLSDQARRGIARLHPDGSLESPATFNPGTGADQGIVDRIAAQPDGRILIAGMLGTVQGQSRGGIARLLPNGSLDETFNPQLGHFGVVYRMSLQTDGRMLVAGCFAGVDGQPRQQIVRLLPDGTRESVDAFESASGSPTDFFGVITQQADGKILPGGRFTSIHGQSRDNIARLHNDPASQDLTVHGSSRVQWFRGGAAPEVEMVTFELSTDCGRSWSSLGQGRRIAQGWELTGLALQASGVVRARGRTFGGASGLVGQTAAFSTDGSSPPPGCPDAINPGTNAGVNVTALQPDGKVLMGGAFSMVAGGERQGLVRLHGDGSLDGEFHPSLDGAVHCIAIQEDGKIIAGGAFGKVDAQTRQNLVRLWPDGRPEPDFHPGTDERVLCAAVQRDGKVVIGGGFTSVDGATRHYLARLHTDGSLDAGFNPEASASVLCLVVEEDGNILLGGAFTAVAGTPRQYLARLHPDGTLDTGFAPESDNPVHSLAVQADGKILAGGDFTTVDGIIRNRLARLHPDSSLDADFTADAAGGTVRALAVQADGKILAAGNFVRVNGQLRRGMARLNADGSLDSGFDDPVIESFSDPAVSSLSLQADGKIVVAGTFSSVGGQARANFVRLHNDPAAASLQNPGPTAIRWLRGGSAPELHHVTFDMKLQGAADWAPLGAGQRMAGGWEMNGLSLPVPGEIRARGRAGASVVEAMEPIRSALELWRLEYFGTDANTGNAANLADPDNDSIPNLIEFALGLNPLRNSAGLLPNGEVTGSDFVLQVSRPAGIGGITYGAEWSASLQPGSWTAVPDTGTPPQHTFRVPTGGHTTLFLRLKVTAL